MTKMTQTMTKDELIISQSLVATKEGRLIHAALMLACNSIHVGHTVTELCWCNDWEDVRGFMKYSDSDFHDTACVAMRRAVGCD